MKVYSHSLQGKRESNEDQHVHILNLDGDDKTMNPINFIAVFDGHGGKSVSRYLKDNLPQFFVNKLKKDIFTKQDKLTDYVFKVYDMIQTKMKEQHPRAVQYCGSTACVTIQTKDKNNKNLIWVINVGDSRAIKCNRNNIAEQLTQDHKPNVPSEKKRITDLGGKIEFDGVDWRVKDLSLSRAFGDIECTPYVTHLPQIYKYKISSSDKFIVLACDGLWDVLTNQDVVDYIDSLKHNNYNGNYAKKVAEYALDKGSMDNISVIILFF
jgi:serine/threonine protein phosphatase PrpC